MYNVNCTTLCLCLNCFIALVFDFKFAIFTDFYRWCLDFGECFISFVRVGGKLLYISVYQTAF